MNRSGIGKHVGDFKITDHINHAAVAFYLHSRAGRHMQRQVDPILWASLADSDFSARDVDVAGLNGRAGRSGGQS